MGAKRRVNGTFAGAVTAAYLLAGLVAVGCDDKTNDSGTSANGMEQDHDHGTAGATDHDHDHAAAGATDHDHGASGAAGEHSHDPSVLVGPKTGATCPQGSTLTFANFGQKFFSDYCLHCHSENVTGAARMNAPADHNFDKLSDIDLLSMHIDEMAGSGPSATNVTMPPSDPKPTMAERQNLSEWIACGVPE